MSIIKLFPQLDSDQSSIRRQLKKLESVIEGQEVWNPIDDYLFIFVCGGNISPGVPSKRRQSLLDFSAKNLPHVNFFLAEPFFRVFTDEGQKGNLLDIEQELSIFSDYIIIILESESAFCELGAFSANSELRKKLLIINNCEFKTAGSFINYGPLQAISEASKEKRLFYYPMTKDGKFDGDGIGEIFSDLYKVLHKEPKQKRKRIKNLNPNNAISKDTLKFVHDLIFFAAPIKSSEFFLIIRLLFGKCEERKLHKHLALLYAVQQIASTNGFYKSMNKDPFLEYSFDYFSLMASFKNLYLKRDNKRFYVTA